VNDQVCKFMGGGKAGAVHWICELMKNGGDSPLANNSCGATSVFRSRRKVTIAQLIRSDRDKVANQRLYSVLLLKYRVQASRNGCRCTEATETSQNGPIVHLRSVSPESHSCPLEDRPKGSEAAAGVFPIVRLDGRHDCRHVMGMCHGVGPTRGKLKH